MLELEWEDMAQDDLIAIAVCIAADNPVAAIALKTEIEHKVAALREQPRMCKPGRVDGTREMIVRKNYIVVYEGRRRDRYGSSCASRRQIMALRIRNAYPVVCVALPKGRTSYLLTALR